MADPRAITRKSSPLSPESDRREVQLAGSPWREDAHAVVIGINQYLDPKIPDLRFARADAEAIHRVLTDPTIGRFKPENVTLLLDDQATERNIRSALGTQLPRRASGDSTVFIYFAGHGAPVIDPRSKSVDGLEKYLIPHDAIADDLRASGIAMETVQQYFSWLDASQVVCFLDSCYSGTAGGRSFDHPSYQTRAMLSDEFLDSLASDGRFVVTACGANEVSLESPAVGHGLFTRYLVEGLRGAADTDQNGKVTIDELYEYVYRNVERDARALGGSMKPVKKGSVRGTVYLTEYETPEKRRAREALQSARAAAQRGDNATALTLWREVLAIEPSNAEATEGLALAESVERQRQAELKRQEKMLLGFVNGGTLSMREYNRALTLLSADPATLDDADRQRRRFLDSLIAGELTIGSYARSIDLLDAHTGEHSHGMVAPPAPVTRASVPAPPVAITPAVASPPPAASPAVVTPPPAPPRPAPSSTTSASPEPNAAQPVAPRPKSRVLPFAIAGVVGAGALVMTIILVQPDGGEIRIDETATAVPATVEPATERVAADSTAQDSVAKAVIEVPSPRKAAGSNEGPQPDAQVRRGLQGSASASTTRTAATPPRPLEAVGLVEPTQATDVRVGSAVRIRFDDLEPGDRIDDSTIDPGNIRVTADGAPVQWRAGASAENVITVVLSNGIREFNTRYSVTIDSGVRTIRGRNLAAPVVLTFSTVFWDPQYYYRLTTEGRGPNVALTANPRCTAEAVGAGGAQEWYFTPSSAAGYYVMRNAARGDGWALEGALPPDECFLHQATDLPTGMLWKVVPSGRPGRFFLRNMNFQNARSLTLGTDANALPFMNPSDPNVLTQHWTFTRTRRR